MEGRPARDPDEEKDVSSPLLKPREVAQLLGIGLSSVYRLAERGTLPTVKIPGTEMVRFRRERIENLVRQWEDKNGGQKRRER